MHKDFLLRRSLIASVCKAQGARREILVLLRNREGVHVSKKGSLLLTGI